METVRIVMSGEAQAAWGKRHMEQNLSRLHGHLLVCGYGRMGRLVCHEFAARKLPFVVIEKERNVLEGFNHPAGIALHGDATSDDILLRAGIHRARALVAVVGKDADNLYITMSARLLNDKLFIVARAEDERSESKLLRAGANRIVAPYVIGGAQVAQAVLRPNVLDFIELATRTEHLELQMEETRITDPSPLVGKTILESKVRSDLGLIIVGIKKPSGHMIFNPPPETVFTAGDILIALGDRKNLDELEAQAQGQITERS
jgi:voltage-gated potassium channel